MYYSITLYFNDKNSPRYFESKCQCSEKIKRRVTKKQSEKGTLVRDCLYISHSITSNFQTLQHGPCWLYTELRGLTNGRFEWATGVITPISGDIFLLITGIRSLCMDGRKNYV